MVLSTATDKPGVLDTDQHGSVLIFPRDGRIDVEIGSSVEAYAGDLLVLAVWAPEDDDADFTLPSSLDNLDAAMLKELSDLITDSEFKAKSGSSTEILRLAGSGAKRVALYGLGKKSKGTSSAAGAAKFAVQKGMAINKCKSVAVYVDEACPKSVTSVAEGAVVASYVDVRYKKEKKDYDKVPASVQIVGIAQSSEYQKAIQRGRMIAMGIITTKELVNAPANVLTPETLAAAAEQVATESGLDIKVMGRAACEDLGMGCYLGVGRGSADEPKFIHLTYKPSGEVKKRYCIVGKAVTFDTGGTNLKVGNSMIELMKFDMGGAAVAVGAAKVIGSLKPEGVEVHFIMPAVENMIGNNAIHPGDILKAANDKTVEVINTDAEGRLCLADAIVYAQNLGDVDCVVDIATLTGAIIVALGNDVAGFWSSSDKLAERLTESSKAVGEQLWRMPLVDEYSEGLKSKIADLRNISKNRGGSSITAALFLKEFVDTKKSEWAHVDIAGTVWSTEKGGATGYGVKTMVNWVESATAE
ncbi:Cytosol aminopeptidase [Gracilaria domingensis]|nr:Cytosol aminopeptidase [Gracilaria domingensis]